MQVLEDVATLLVGSFQRLRLELDTGSPPREDLSNSLIFCLSVCDTGTDPAYRL